MSPWSAGVGQGGSTSKVELDCSGGLSPVRGREAPCTPSNKITSALVACLSYPYLSRRDNDRRCHRSGGGRCRCARGDVAAAAKRGVRGAPGGERRTGVGSHAAPSCASGSPDLR